MRFVRVGGPDLLPVEQPATRNAFGAGAHAGEVRSRIGLAHADAEEQLAIADARQQIAPLRLGAVVQQQRRALAIANPVRRDGSTGGEQFLDQHEPGKGIEPGAAIFDRDGQPDPAAPGHGPAEVCIKTGPGPRPDMRGHASELLGDEGLHVAAQGFGMIGYGGGGEVIQVERHALISICWGWVS